MEIKVGFEIAYAAVQPTPMVIMLFDPSSRYSDIVAPKASWPSLILQGPARRSILSRQFWQCLRAPRGAGRRRDFRGSALRARFRIARCRQSCGAAASDRSTADELLLYLMPSRYCETDKLTDIAWSLFGNTRPGWERVLAITAFVHHHVTFGYEHAHHMKSAHDVYEQRTGVCRDFAHLALTFCRCMGIPARYGTGYMGDIGVPPDPAPIGFLGWFRSICRASGTRSTPAIITRGSAAS